MMTVGDYACTDMSCGLPYCSFVNLNIVVSCVLLGITAVGSLSFSAISSRVIYKKFVRTFACYRVLVAFCRISF